MRHRDVNDRQHHEDVRLQRHDQDMEYRPDPTEHRPKDRSGKAGRSPHPDQQEDDFASVHVAEQTHRMGQWLGDVLDQIEQEVEWPNQRIGAERRAEQFMYPATQPFDLDAESDHQQPH